MVSGIGVGIGVATDLGCVGVRERVVRVKVKDVGAFGLQRDAAEVEVGANVVVRLSGQFAVAKGLVVGYSTQVAHCFINSGKTFFLFFDTFSYGPMPPLSTLTTAAKRSNAAEIVVGGGLAQLLASPGM